MTFLDELQAVREQVLQHSTKELGVPPAGRHVVRFRPPADRRNGSDELEPVDPEGGPLRFDAGDERWGTDVKTARDCVAKLYNLDTQPLAAAGHADVLVDWLQGLDAAIQTRVEGEFGGGAA
jgi:hypothetical protein